MGLFFKDYESAGVGIAKNAPKKTGIKLFFELFGRKFWKLIEVNFLYSLFFIPFILSGVPIIFPGVIFLVLDNAVVALALSFVFLLIFLLTIGPATAGVTKIMRNYVLEKHSFILSDFFKAFKQNYKKSVLIGIIDFFVLLSVWAGYYIYPALAESYGKTWIYIPMIISFSLAIIVIMMNFYGFLMLIATDLSFKNLVKNSFALAFVELKRSFITFIICLAILVVVVLAALFVPGIVFLLPFIPLAILAFIICFNSYPVIQKYVINPYYTSIGEVNPEIAGDDFDDEEPIFEDMGGKEKPIEKRKKGKGKRIS